MAKRARHYGWWVSPYSAKTRSYLRFSQIDFEDIEPSAFVLKRRVQRAVGRLIMPTLELPDGRWLQDSSVIIAHLEAEGRGPSITPPGSNQAFASALLELFADEWLPMAALHYRWNTPENAAFALDEFARSAFPLLPRIVGRPLIAGMAEKMKSYLDVLGVAEHMQEVVERCVRDVIQALDVHFSESDFVFGGRPSLADFGLFGPLWAHLYRDPGSRALFDAYPALRRWMDEMEKGPEVRGDFLSDDHIPDALNPIFLYALRDQWAWIRTLVKAIDSYVVKHPEAERVPRALGNAEFTFGGARSTRKLVTFVQYKAQHAVERFSLNPAKATSWMERVLGNHSVEAVIPEITHPFVLRNFKPVLAARVR